MEFDFEDIQRPTPPSRDWLDLKYDDPERPPSMSKEDGARLDRQEFSAVLFASFGTVAGVLSSLLRHTRSRRKKANSARNRVMNEKHKK